MMPPPAAPRPVILDGDPGHDDAINILLACSSPELEVLGVTTTYGNVGLERTTQNALIVRELINQTSGADFPIYAGADRPLVVPRLSAESVHGASGLDGPDFPTPKRGAEALHAAEFIIHSVRQRPHQVTLLPTGPLTNLALALRLAPDIAPLIREVVWMGGSLDTGNWTPSAEFNALCDPHAARIVFECAAETGLKLTMFGLNATHQAIANPARVAAFRQLGSKVGEFTAVLLEFFAEHHRERYGWDGGALHDPMTAAYLIAPDLFEVQAMRVDIDISDGLSAGRTVCDVWRVTGQPPNADVALKVNADGFFNLLVERIARYR
ncbi:nucleoside hydrolase [Deinococcus psychrotolerans]|uniref:Nucleoside hydrolase n=1 Tax=Deinococcus psychrotolerans TaxID=2489213 RepID=A0A3G8YL40_9DEIO|nr:nucleoside hydrolase [Deinococcus psychrotolerans]AZI43314.1 nucleoside hydrolase [Deinococcus psychrotolerans]